VKHRAIIRSRADCDEEEIFEFLARRSLASAHRFLDNLHDTLRTLCDRTTPGMPVPLRIQN
jgi:plasmid stabilization system protein ParE